MSLRSKDRTFLSGRSDSLCLSVGSTPDGPLSVPTFPSARRDPPSQGRSPTLQDGRLPGVGGTPRGASPRVARDKTFHIGCSGKENHRGPVSSSVL